MRELVALSLRAALPVQQMQPQAFLFVTRLSKSAPHRGILEIPQKPLHVGVVVHLVMDTLVIHELRVNIPDEAIEERRPEWIATVITAKTRSEYVKGLLHFCGLDLLDYDTALIERTLNSYLVRLSSEQYNLRQPR